MKLLTLTLLLKATTAVYFYQCHYKGVAGVGNTYNLHKKCKPSDFYIWQWSQGIGAIGTMGTGGKPINCLKKGCIDYNNQLRRRDCVTYDNGTKKCKRWDGNWINV